METAIKKYLDSMNPKLPPGKEQIAAIDFRSGWEAYEEKNVSEIQYLTSQNNALKQALEGHEDPHLHSIAWVGTLYRACKKKEVYEALVKSNDNDADAINIMLSEIWDFLEKTKVVLNQNK